MNNDYPLELAAVTACQSSEYHGPLHSRFNAKIMGIYAALGDELDDPWWQVQVHRHTGDDRYDVMQIVQARPLQLMTEEL